MDLVVAGLGNLPFWDGIVSLGEAKLGLSQEITAALLIGLLTTLASILMLRKAPDLVALVSFFLAASPPCLNDYILVSLTQTQTWFSPLFANP